MGDSTSSEVAKDAPNWDEAVAEPNATVVLAIRDSRTLGSLRSWFEANGHDVRVVEPGALPVEGDLFVVDQGALREAEPTLRELKDGSETFVPCLLLVSEAHSDSVATSTDAVLDVVDDVLETPLRRPELRRRVESLLRARSASTQLREERAHHQRLVELLPAGLFVLDDEHRVTYANAAAAELLGTTTDALVDATVQELVHPADRGTFTDQLDRLDPERTEQVRLLPEYADADTEPAVSGVEPVDDDVVDDAPGAVVVESMVGAVGVDDAVQVLVRDVTERERRVERLRLFERAIAEAGIGITIADARAEDEPLVFANDGFCELTGYDCEDVIGRNCRFLQGEDTDPAAVTEIRDALDAENPVSVTLRNYRADGTEFWNHLEVTPVEDDTGTVTHYLGFQRDVTERRERMRLFEHLHEATRRLQRAESKDAVAESAVRSVRDILGLDVATCWFPSEDDATLEPVATVGLDESASLDSTTVGWQTYVDRRDVVEAATTTSGMDAETALLFSLGEHGLLGAADCTKSYTDAVRDAGQAFADHVVVSLDRAEREAELAATTAELESTLERIKDGFISLDTDYDITFVNQRAEALLPYAADELEGMNLWDAFPEEVDGRFWEEYHAALETGEARTFEAHYEERDVWFEVSAYPSDDGLTLYFRDVTGQRERKRELERYETIVQTAGDPIYTLDESGRFTSVNNAFVDLTGYDREAVLGEHARAVLRNEDVARCERVVADLVAESGPEREAVEIVLETRQGDRRYCEITIATLPGETFTGTVGVLRDLTELKDTEQRIAVLDRVLRHNLRNNMNVVAGRAGALREHPDDAVRESVAVVEDAAMDVLDIANKARSFQHALEDEDVATGTVDVDAVVRHVVADLRGEYEHATVTVDVGVDGPVPVRGNEAVALAVRELVVNGVEHNPSDDPTVHVSVTRDDDEVSVVVADDGPEIPEQEVHVLRGDLETPLEHASGLGLWLVRWTASTFRGHLAFDTSPDGNDVSLCLPIATDD
jgi:PAS domain S-box-containing protein